MIWRSKKGLVLIFAFIAVSLLTGLFVFLLLDNTDLANRTEHLFYSKSCTKEDKTFSVAPVELDKLTNIVPLGNLNPSGHTFPTVHMYYFLNDKSNVYAPTDAVIDTITVSTRTDIEPDQTDYSVDFRTCEDFSFYFIHVTSLSEKLQKVVEKELESNDDCGEEYTTGGRTFKNCWLSNIGVEVSAGEIIGTAWLNSEAQALDFGVTDFGIEPHTFANPDRWVNNNREDKLYRVCSTDYYQPELKQTLESYLIDHDGTPRTVEPICGTNAQDVPGTAQGIWFLKGSEQGNSEDKHIALVHDNLDPTIGAISNGVSLGHLGINSGVYIFDPETTGHVNLDFSLVKPSQDIYCYEVAKSFVGQDNGFSILLQLETEDTINVGKYGDPNCGPGPWELDNYVTFVR